MKADEEAARVDLVIPPWELMKRLLKLSLWLWKIMKLPMSIF
jgi:hypothetical protein